MVAVHPKRGSIVDLHRAGMKLKKIARTLGVPLTTVYRSIKFFNTTGDTVAARSGGPRTAFTIGNMEKIRILIQRNPQSSMRKMAKGIGIDEGPVRTIVHKKLNNKSFKTFKSPGLTEAIKKKGMQKRKELLIRTAR
ncbi:hypothetical protein ANCDUO_24632, partial [Ancylostoma duodenale]